MSVRSKRRVQQIIDKAMSVVANSLHDTQELLFEFKHLYYSVGDEPYIDPKKADRVIDIIVKLGYKQRKIEVAIKDSRELLEKVISHFDPEFVAKQASRDLDD